MGCAVGYNDIVTGRNDMVDWEFEKFILEQVRRERAIYIGMAITFACCAIACLVMAVAAMIIFRAEAFGTCLKLLLLVPMFAGMCIGVWSVTRRDRKAEEEIAYAIDHPESCDPDEYTETTQRARSAACRILRSIRGLIISYGLMALMLWAVTLLIAALAISEGMGYGYLFAAFVTFSMALALSILTIAYLCDLPAARRYRQIIDRSE